MARWVVVGGSALVGLALAYGCSPSGEKPDGADAGAPAEAGAPPTVTGRNQAGEAPGPSTGHGGSPPILVPTVGGAELGGEPGVGGVTSGGVGGDAGEVVIDCGAPATCEAYCDYQSLPRECTSPEGKAPCLEFCEQQIAQFMPASCQDTWQAFLECGACAPISCEADACSGGFCIDDPPHQTACDALWDAALACAGPCLSGGTRGGSGIDYSYRYVESHCSCPATTAPGLPAGEPCSSYSDCQEECCSCSESSGKFLARRCEDGLCVAGSALCELVEADELAGFCASEGGF
jgi:hypothetical protein